MLPLERQLMGLIYFGTQLKQLYPIWFGNNDHQSRNLYPGAPHDLNDDQNQAIEAAKRNRLTLIQG